MKIMKKTLFATALLFVIGLASCQKEEKTVDVTISSGFIFEKYGFKDEGQTRLDVVSHGGTNWSPGDYVYLVDWDEGRSARPFRYLPETPDFRGAFSGRLLAGQGVKTYYAYHMPDETNGSHATSMILYINRGHDMDITENGQILEHVFGRHCAMVAVPLAFDAENPESKKNIQFHHVNSMIEARIASKTSDPRLRAVTFDKVVFTFIATDTNPEALPFSTEVEIDMTRITNGGASTSIPFTEYPNTKIGKMSTAIKYDEVKNLGDLIGQTNYCVPIFALPTTSRFSATATVEFLLDNKLVARLSKDGTGNGLNLSGLNPIPFNEENLKVYNVEGPTRRGDCDDDDDDDQGEDNDGQ
jgi:hypothetical protein